MFLKATDSCWTLQRRAPTTLQASVHCCLVSELTAIRVTSAFLWLVQYIKQRIESDTFIVVVQHLVCINWSQQLNVLPIVTLIAP